MKYNKETFDSILNSLTNKHIAEVYYYDCNYYDKNRNVNNLVKLIKEDSFGAILIKFDSGELVNITSTDYEPNLSLGGIKISQEEFRDDEDRLSRMSETIWSQYKKFPIVSHSIIEDNYSINNKNLTIPLGISFTFENNLHLYILNLEIEQYNTEKEMFDFVKGSSALTIFFSQKEFSKYNFRNKAT